MTKVFFFKYLKPSPVVPSIMLFYFNYSCAQIVEKLHTHENNNTIVIVVVTS